jgi:hypothetical protein
MEQQEPETPVAYAGQDPAGLSQRSAT